MSNLKSKLPYILISVTVISAIGLVLFLVWHSNSVIKQRELWSEAVLTGDIEKLENLLEAGADVNTYIQFEHLGEEYTILGPATALHIQCAFGNLETVQLLLRHSADVNSQDGRGSTSLHFASMRNNPALISILVEAGVDMELCGNSGTTPLIAAAFMSNVEAVKSLINFGADLNAQRISGGTALIDVAANGSVEIARLLIEAGADIELASDTDTVLHIAAGNASVGVMKLLLEFGADPSKRSHNGYTVLIDAAGNSRSAEAVRFLLEMGADPNEISNVRGWKGLAPLHEAAEYGTVEIVKLLLEAGADPQATTEHGRTPLSKAEERDDDLKDEIIALLKIEIKKRSNSSD